MINWKKCPGYEGHPCGRDIASQFKVCQTCFDHFRFQELDKSWKKNKKREFWQDKLALGTLNN
mgnify:CR=1 FL=1